MPYELLQSRYLLQGCIDGVSIADLQQRITVQTQHLYATEMTPDLKSVEDKKFKAF